MQENISRQFKEMQKTIDDMNKKLNIKKEIIIKEPNRNFAAEIFKHEIKKKKTESFSSTTEQIKWEKELTVWRARL